MFQVKIPALKMLHQKIWEHNYIKVVNLLYFLPYCFLLRYQFIDLWTCKCWSERCRGKAFCLHPIILSLIFCIIYSLLTTPRSETWAQSQEKPWVHLGMVPKIKIKIKLNQPSKQKNNIYMLSGYNQMVNYFLNEWYWQYMITSQIKTRHVLEYVF